MTTAKTDTIRTEVIAEYEDGTTEIVGTFSKHKLAADFRWLLVQNAREQNSTVRYGLQTRQVTVLAEFPVTLADLIPDGCEAFRFKRKYGVELTATKGTEAGVWVIGGMQDYWRDLNKLSADLGVDLDTVVPLVITVHSDYIEARR